MSNEITNYIVGFRKYWEENKGSKHNFEEPKISAPEGGSKEATQKHRTYAFKEKSQSKNNDQELKSTTPSSQPDTEPVPARDNPNPNTTTVHKKVYKGNEEVYANAYDTDHSELLNRYWAWHAVPLFLEDSAAWYGGWDRKGLDITFRGMRVYDSLFDRPSSYGSSYGSTYNRTIHKIGYNNEIINKLLIKELESNYGSRDDLPSGMSFNIEEAYNDRDPYDIFYELSFNTMRDFSSAPFNGMHTVEYDIYKLTDNTYYDPANLPAHIPVPQDSDDDLPFDRMNPNQNPSYRDVYLSRGPRQGNDLVKVRLIGREWEPGSQEWGKPRRKESNGFYFIKSLFKEYCSAEFYKQFVNKQTLINYLKNNQKEETVKNVKALKQKAQAITNVTIKKDLKFHKMEDDNTSDFLKKTLELVNDNLKNKIIVTTKGEFFLLLGDKVELNFCINLKTNRKAYGAKSFLRLKLCSVEAHEVEVSDGFDEESVESQTAYYRKQSEWVFSNRTRSIVPYIIGANLQENRREWEEAMSGYAAITIIPQEGEYKVTPSTESERMEYCNNFTKNFLGRDTIGSLDDIELCTKAINLNKMLPSFTTLEIMSDEAIRKLEDPLYQEYAMCRDFLALSEIDCVFEFSDKELKPKSTPEPSEVAGNFVIIFDENKELT